MVEYKTISIIIPSYNRQEVLIECLAGYKKQTFSARDFEVVIVDDGSAEPIAGKMKLEEYDFNIRILRQEHAGPAAARNLAIRQVTNDILLFAGDDIIPAADFLEKHMKAHARYLQDNMAVLGNISWPEGMAVNALMHYVTENGGQQFSLSGLQDQQIVGYQYFYTSNISLKRRYLLKTAEFFSPLFTKACFEDIELGYRLCKKHGLKILFDKTINVFHRHPMSLGSFYKRQFNVGQMAVVLDRLHPEFFAKEKKSSLKAGFPVHENIPPSFLDYYRSMQAFQKALGTTQEARRLFKKMEQHFFMEVLSFAFRGGASYFNQKNPHDPQ
ncbi:MAG: glycosyltransferase [Candidatus Omnitrophica bacterium]|nr:glycosyltransferase [Candidatus Omnitrophota bacterium]